MSYLAYKKSGSVYQVYIDGEYAGPFHYRQLAEIMLHSADDEVCEVSEEEIAKLRKEQKKFVREHYSMLAAGREICAFDLEKKMKQKGYENRLIQDTIDYLYENRFLDDSRYIESYIRQYGKKQSAQFVKRELLAKQFDADTIERISEELKEDMGICDDETIRKIFETKFSTMDHTDEKAKNRVLSYFLRRGYTYGQIKNYLT